MTKGQKRSNKEAKKPKKPKAAPAAPASLEKGVRPPGGTPKKES